MRVLAEIGVGGVDGQRCVTLVRLVSHTAAHPLLQHQSPPKTLIEYLLPSIVFLCFSPIP